MLVVRRGVEEAYFGVILLGSEDAGREADLIRTIVDETFSAWWNDGNVRACLDRLIKATQDLVSNLRHEIQGRPWPEGGSRQCLPRQMDRSNDGH